MLGTITARINIEKLNKRSKKKKLNANLEHHVQDFIHSRMKSLLLYIYIYIY